MEHRGEQAGALAASQRGLAQGCLHQGATQVHKVSTTHWGYQGYRGVNRKDQDSLLVCVRNRYDEQHQKRFRTIELIVEERAWISSPSQKAQENLVLVRVAGSIRYFLTFFCWDFTSTVCL